MQFYMIHKDAKTSAKLLPDYALKKVNIREGWQILSDIGHIHGIKWNGQNRLYSASHALTRSFCSKDAYNRFIQHYNQNLIEYEARFKSRTVFHDKFEAFADSGIGFDLYLVLPESTYESTRQYLLSQKTKHLSEDEIVKLTDNIKLSQ